MSVEELVNYLIEQSFCLMTEEDGVELCDQEGNLIVMKEDTGEMKSVPNMNKIRCLFDLPLRLEVQKSGLKKKNTNSKDKGSENHLQGVVWHGKRTDRCKKAIDTLIDLYASEKYQDLMKIKCKTKMKVWEGIANDLHSQGFIIADNLELAGRRTFQKWRNITKSYWTIMKNPEDFGSDKRKKRPSYFDKLHNVLSETTKSETSFDFEVGEPVAGPSSEGSVEVETGCEESTDGGYEGSSERALSAEPPPEANGKRFKFSKDMIKMMIALSTTTKYKNVFNKRKPSSIAEWGRIYDFISTMFNEYARTRQEGACILRKKWRTLQINKFGFKQTRYTPYSFQICKSVIDDLAKSNIATVKGCKAESFGVENVDKSHHLYRLLNLLESEEYQILLRNNRNSPEIWRKICTELLSKGTIVPGESIRQKTLRLYKQWMELKEDFLKYQLGKEHNPELKPPPFYDKILRIVFKEIKINNGGPKNQNLNAKSKPCVESTATHSMDSSNLPMGGLVASLDTATTHLGEIKSISAASFEHQKRALEDISHTLERTERNISHLYLLVSEALKDD